MTRLIEIVTDLHQDQLHCSCCPPELYYL